MFYSKNKRLYDLILDKLNENTQDVLFSGNYMFEFNQQQTGTRNFEIVSRDSDSLEFSTTDFVPLVDVQSIQVPFVENNERDDYEREFYVAIYMPETTNETTNQTEYKFSESNPQYQAILETLENLRSNLTFTDGGYKYTFKVKEPTKVGVMTYGAKYYQLLAMTFNLTSLTSGFFGNETKAYFGLKSDLSFDETDDYELDFMDLTEVVGKATRPISNVNDTDEKYTIDKRLWEATLTINFNGNVADLLIYKEKAATSDLNLEYQIKITNKNLNTFADEDLDYTYNVLLSTVNASYKNNVVDQLTFKLERVW